LARGLRRHRACLAVVAKWENFHVDFAYWGWFGAETTFQTVKRIGDLWGYDKLCFGSENSHTHMAVEMFQSFGNAAKNLGVAPVSPENMEKIMWKNTARLWKINPNSLCEEEANRGGEMIVSSTRTVSTVRPVIGA
jgi:predicted TIM-barrel fold metal-dependent hydrolase